MSNKRYIRRPVEDAAIGKVDRKRKTENEKKYRTVAPFDYGKKKGDRQND